MSVEPVGKTSESTLRKAVKNAKQLLKKEDVVEEEKPVKVTRKSNPLTWNRGLVYIGHIPHGFFEEQMRDYFKQFGKVTRVRLVRSKKTGQSRGYGYVEFLHSEVAKIAAETMNNYLMADRLLKAAYIPPEKQHKGYFVGREWTLTDYPLLQNRKTETRLHNKNINNKKYTKFAKRTINHLSAIEKKLQARGIAFKVQPVDVPEGPQSNEKKPLLSKKVGAKKVSVPLLKSSEVKKLKKENLDEMTIEVKKIKSENAEKVKRLKAGTKLLDDRTGKLKKFKKNDESQESLVLKKMKETEPKQVKKWKNEKVQKVKRLKGATNQLNDKSGKLKKSKKNDESRESLLMKKVKKMGSKKVL